MESNIIYNEDCLETMIRFPDNSIDLVLTSPPYNIIRPKGNDVYYDVYVDDKSNQEYISWTLDIFKSYDRILKPNVPVIYNLSYGQENSEIMNLTVAEILKQTNFTLADIIVWKKGNAIPNSTSHNKLTRIVEFVYIFCRADEFMTFKTNKEVTKQNSAGQTYYANIFNFVEAVNQDEYSGINTATFSSELVRKLLDIYAKPDSLIYDSFMGTGTTAVGAVMNNHRFIGSEISKQQCEYANKRLKPYLTQTKLF